MNSITNLLRERLYNTSFERDSNSYQALSISEWSDIFEQLMRNRLIMGALRYGKMCIKGKPKYDRATRIEQYITSYKKGGNLEDLVDIANLAMMEFLEGDHPNKHFNSIDDGGHTKEIK